MAGEDGEGCGNKEGRGKDCAAVGQAEFTVM